VPKGNYPGVYDPVTNTLTFTPDKDKGKLGWWPATILTVPIILTAVLRYLEEELDSAELTLNELNVFVIGQSGGHAFGLVNGITVTVDIPNGACRSRSTYASSR
jgi:hypothetical protein